MIPLPYIALLTIVSIAAGMGILFAIGTFSNRQSLALAKRQIWAQLYALRLYSDEPPVIWQVQKRLLVWNARYLFQMLRPLAIVFLPLSGLLFVLDGFYSHRPLRAGETALVIVHSENQNAPLVGHEVSIETPALRIPAERAVYWRIRAQKDSGDLVFGAQRTTIHAGSGLAYISACSRCFGNPIEVRYPPAYIAALGFHMSWPLWFFIVSGATVVALRKSRFLSMRP